MDDQLVPRPIDDTVTETAGDELFVFTPADEMMHALNESAAAVLAACDGTRTVKMIADEVEAEGITFEMVQLGLAELRDAGLIAYEPAVEGPSRRQLLLKLGAGAAAVAAIPVIESIIAPKAAAASSAPTPTPTPTPAPTPTPTPTPTPCDPGTWDKSSYVADKPLGLDGSGRITTEVCNHGDRPGTCPVDFKVWYAAGGNPKNGTVVGQGSIPPLGPKPNCRTVDITAYVTLAGKYKVQFFQHPLHPGNSTPWSDTYTHP